MHSEDKADSELLVDKITEFIAYAKERNYEDCVDTMASFLKAAQTFTQILTVYGRFPHRNALLGRQDTPDEVEYNKNGRIPEHMLKRHGLKPQRESSSKRTGLTPNARGASEYNKGLGQVKIDQRAQMNDFAMGSKKIKR